MKYVSQMYNFNISSVVKTILIVNFVIWFALVVILQGLFFEKNYVFYFLGLTPNRIFQDFWLWQTFTYMFVHAQGVFHILFNMFALWMFGSELERLWGARFFLTYYLVCGLGAGFIYLLSLFIGSSFFNLDSSSFSIPMVGASGAIFGVLFAYGLIFSERIILFMMIFPMKAFHFTLLIGLIEFVSLINSGVGSPVSHLSHLAGFLTGFLFLQSWKKIQNLKIRKWKRRPTHLKILRNESNEDKKTYH
ncbi:MAG: rhomboid family intramembrane serine protease [Bdellovibrionaceae bacterium]|nr:rhomboid family intramembrane serine protease [Pseudobdellovibrionaceae bacterium]